MIGKCVSNLVDKEFVGRIINLVFLVFIYLFTFLAEAFIISPQRKEIMARRQAGEKERKGFIEEKRQ